MLLNVASHFLSNTASHSLYTLDADVKKSIHSPSEASAVLQNLLDSAQQHGKHRTFDVGVAMDSRRQGLRQHFKWIEPSALAV